ncbi:MAG TPA: DNA polymerase I, partial [Dehalococcoidales bacterium]|nr:DNA polymerase I [Dehalococcoidales bacterium]
MKKPLLVLFDGNALIHRAYHALPPLTVSKTGEMVSAVYGFAQMLLKVLSELKPTHYAIAFDKKAPTFRHKLFDQYKAQRPPMPDELVNQLGRVRELVEAFRIPIFELDGYEADDLLGTLSHQASQQDMETIIVTGDADAMQLVSPKVSVLYPKPGRSFSDTMLYDEAAVSNKYGVKPENIADFKGLVGDPSDNIPGVAGVGAKTAAKLIQQFGTIEQIYDHIDEVTPPKLQDTLREKETIARQSKELATIVTQAPVSLELANCQVGQYDRQQVTELLRELEFASLRSRLPEFEVGEAATESTQVQVKAKPPQGDYHIINTTPALDELMSRLSATKSFAFDTETTGLNPMSAQLVGLSFSPARGEAYYIPVGHVCLEQITQLPLEQVIDRIKPVLEDASLTKLAHNGKYDMTVLGENGITVNNLTFDTMVAAYLLCEKSLSLKTLAFSKLNVEMTPISELIGSGAKQLTMSQVAIKQAADYACADADITGQLAELLSTELHQQGLWQLFSEVEMPLVPVLLHMERNGIALDTALLREMSQQLGEQLIKLETEIFSSVGHQFNINSPQQLGLVLFEELKLPAARKGKNKYSTEASVLEELSHDYPIARLILNQRQLTKLKSTYIDALPGLINPKTGRVHTSFNQTRTATGRLSSSEPNLQNIPIRGEMGRQIRQAFIAPQGSRLLGGDYSQIDLRALAHLSQDPGLLGAFQRDEDIHAATAAQLYGVDTSQVTPDMRRLAKTVNFGVIYGMSEYGLEQATELSREEAAQFITAYFEKYAKVKQYLEATKEQARKTGYVQTILGRRRFIPEINSSNRQIREGAERMAINMPV